jgi:nickel/cobalt transporter (NicO) family protein
VTRGTGRKLSRRLLLMVAIALLILAAGAFTSAFAQVGPFGGLRPPPANGVIGWILTKQALFYRALSGLIRTTKTDGSAYWGLMGISFVYGIFHAAGPGHGKAVISSYLVANEETWRRGIALSLASALLQALTAVVIVAVAAILIGATAKMMGDTVRAIEIISYALIVLLGARLLWVKGRGFLHALHKVRSEPEPATAPLSESHACHDHVHDRNHAHHHHDEHAHSHAHPHDDDEDNDVLPWGHAHGPEPQELSGPGGWRRGLSAIVAVGLRPCSGAIIVLVFALAQGLFWAGVASTFVMGLGTAITVAAIATLAVGAKAAAKRYAATNAGYGTLVLRGVEVGAAFVVMLFGALLLTGTMTSERIGLF